MAYLPIKSLRSMIINIVAFDIQKEKKHKNIIILVDDLKRIDLNYFAFGNNRTLIIEDNEENREKLKYLHSVKWKAVVDKYYNGVHLSEYIFGEYSNNKDKFINTFCFLDTEKINRFKNFIRESLIKRAYVICNREVETVLRKELPDANFYVVDLENYIDKVTRYYYCQML